MKKHAVHLLYEQRLARSTKPFKARGGAVRRCAFCRIDAEFCICAFKPELSSNAGFLLLYYDDEVLKPSNSGRLIADLIPDTFAFIWQRTSVEQALLEVLADPQWQPMVIFPEEYAAEGRSVFRKSIVIEQGKRPLFILLDGSWREAKKMFRNSEYLDKFPVLAFNPEQKSRYLVRTASYEHHLATAEVAAAALTLLGEVRNGEFLDTWFDVFSYRYQQGVMRKNQGDASSLDRLELLLAKVN
ncbi:tRNA-uridine aminocarboxypropyltransferase [Reinekea sp.]|jgi:DTW domain-containing protein YfiP|uniref:tRNA-uridine aminocarboxypropyltransferase n=1 Tax=Reinekea sp. TaxID=1970455 RepID=UPI00398A4AC2